ncbi:ROK family transcriptional regulator [Jiangella anatolica]|uniref:HTH marR-type domain-containing protein n=1 Tax=Jiangella anatolica TaxID=2670374 RepID=A0A2W2C1T5_9ACTN|nr:ROK family transcriptional regulator [Jiangella anatolica]PZF81937.1 hypothetical protein C1I92_19115 [Jiangella anatolica]
MRTASDTRTTARLMNERAVLQALYRHGPCTRGEVADLLGFSRPTTNSIVESLATAGLVVESGQAGGRIGRTAALFAINREVGYVVGVDVGPASVSAVLADVFGVEFAAHEEDTDTSSAAALLDQVVAAVQTVQARARVATDKVAAALVAVPGTVEPGTGRVALMPHLPDFGPRDVQAELSERIGARVLVHNDVNLAAIAEGSSGLAQGIDDYGFMHVGAGTGLGLVINGRLCVGRTGAAGEIGWLPFGGDPLAPGSRHNGAFEAAIGGHGLAERYRERRGGEGPAITVAEVFARAGDGDPLAAEVVDREAYGIAMALASVTTIVEPQLLILGGEVGLQPALLQPVRGYLDRLVPRPPAVETSTLGARASIAGAIALGVQEAREGLFGRRDVSPAAPGAAPVRA